MTNPKMLSSENSCSIYQYLHQDQNQTILSSFLPSLYGPMHYYLMPRKPKEEEPSGKFTALRKPKAAARI